MVLIISVSEGLVSHVANPLSCLGTEVFVTIVTFDCLFYICMFSMLDNV